MRRDVGQATDEQQQNAEPWIDSLSKTFARGTSRRSIIKLLVGGVVGAVVGGNVFAEPAFIRANSNSLKKAATAPLCPNRVPNGTAPSFNGCGSDYSSYVVPNHYHLADFTSACNNHDICYSTCNKTKADCDLNFFNDLKKACNAAYPAGSSVHDDCINRAQYYYQAVDDYASGPYNDSQRQVCKCCAGVTCGDICCDSGSVCCNGTCCPAGQSCCNGTCSANGCQGPRYLCPCNHQTYPDAVTCQSNCTSSLGCINSCRKVS